MVKEVCKWRLMCGNGNKPKKEERKMTKILSGICRLKREPLFKQCIKKAAMRISDLICTTHPCNLFIDQAVNSCQITR